MKENLKAKSVNSESYKIELAVSADYPAIMDVWESAVRATHYFLKEEDFIFYKESLPLHYLPKAAIQVIKDENKEIVGFISVSEGNLDMLFIHADMRGKGIGKKLLKYAIDNLGVETVDVNEQNEQAVGYYKKHGFQVTKRNELDGQGKPYPILEMELQNK